MASKRRISSVDGAAIIKRNDELRRIKQPLVRHWQDAYNYTYPVRGEGFGGTTGSNAEALTGSARSKQAEIYDCTAIECSRLLASSLLSGITPANSRWFDLADDDNTERKGAAGKWLSGAADAVWRNIHASNYDVTAFEVMLDYIIGGMAGLYTEDGAHVGKPYNFVLWPLYSLACADSTGSGRIDTVYREFTLSAEQTVATYGEDAVSDSTRGLARTKPDTQIELIQAIYPRPKKEITKFNLPFASIHIERKSKVIVRESGYHEMPVAIPRWLTIPDSVYSLGAVHDALPTIKSVNELVKLILANMDMATAGMWGALNDGVLNPRTVRVGPRKVIPMASKDSLFPLTTGTKFDASFLNRDVLQAEIRRLMFADHLQPQDGPAMTATEVHVRAGLIRQLLGPAYGRLQVDFLAPLVERCFGLAYRAGALEPAPLEMQGKPLRIKYQSPLARAQRLEEVAAMDRYEMGLMQKSQINAEILDIYDWEEAERKRADYLGVPAGLLIDADKVLENREKKKQAQAAAARAQQMAGMIDKVAPELVKGAMNNPEMMRGMGGGEGETAAMADIAALMQGAEA